MADWPPSSQLEVAAERASKRALQYEYQLKAFEANLAENLSNFRAIEGLLQEAFVNLQRTSRRADRAVTTHVPYINESLDTSLDALTDLAEKLPTIQTQVRHIRAVYDSGRTKAKELVHALTYLNTPFQHRLLQIVFTLDSPVSTRTKVLLRLWFGVVFLLCMVLLLVGARGAIRVYRVRLMWGEKLMS